MKSRFKNQKPSKKVEKLLRRAVKDAHQRLSDIGAEEAGFRVNVYVDTVQSRVSLRNDWGVTAMVYGDDRFKIAIDRDRVGDPQVLENFKSLIVHEANHLDLMRLNGKDPQTLAEVLVSEGFAQVAEQQASFAKPLGENLLTLQQLNDFSEEVKSHLGDDLFAKERPEKDFGYWFARQESLNRHFNKGSGYALGLQIVKSYMDDNNLSMRAGNEETYIRNYQILVWIEHIKTL